MEIYKGIPTFHAPTRAAWRDWLEKNHRSEKSVWLIIYKKDSPISSVYYPEAVDEALCFGWIDSKPNQRDANSYYQFFARRNPKSHWSRVNKEKVKKLMEQGLMQSAGFEVIEAAQANGAWTALDEVETGTVPEDLRAALSKNKWALDQWEHFPRSAKRGLLEWILKARKPATRQKRIEETVSQVEKNRKADHDRP